MNNESSSKEFIKKFNEFTDYKFTVRIKWLTEKVKIVFRIKIYLCTKPVKFIKVFAHVEKFIFLKLSGTLKYVVMSTIIQCKSQIH